MKVPFPLAALLCALFLMAHGAATTVNVADYGATGDGVTDDRAAIQSAIDALAADPAKTTLYFPPGDYRLASLNATNTPSWYAENEPGNTNRSQLLIRTELAGRDIVITGQNARLYNAIPTIRASILEIRGSMRTLAVRGLKFERNSTPLAPFSDQSDGLLIQPFDSAHVVDSVTIEDCIFINCHRAYTVGVWTKFINQGKCRSFLSKNNTLLFPYGANSADGAANGGGQMIFVGGWVDEAEISHEFADGMSGDITDTVHCPGQSIKDGWFFGSPLNRLSIHDCEVRHFSIEGIYQLGLAQNALDCLTEQGFVVPAADDTATATVVIQPNFPVPPLNQNSAMYIPNVGYFTTRAFDPVTRVLTITNPGSAVNIPPQSTVPGNQLVYDLSRPTPQATIANNIIDARMPTGATFNFPHTGPGTDALHTIDTQAVITGNHIIGAFYSISVQSRFAAPLNDVAAGSRIENNQVEMLDSRLISFQSRLVGIIGWGVNSLLIAGNQVTLPVARSAFAICLEAAAGQTPTGAIVRQNEVRAVTPPPGGLMGYGSVDRAVAYAVGFANATTFTDNLSAGFDVGIGPSTPNQNRTYTINSHRTEGDTRPIDDRGPAFTTLPDLNGDGLPDAWQTIYFGATDGHGALADDDRDGLNNLLELALQRNPMIPDASPFTVVGENGWLTLTIQKVPRVSYFIESAGDLSPGSWSTTTTTKLIDTSTQLKVRDNVPLGSAASRYLRLRVTSP